MTMQWLVTNSYDRSEVPKPGFWLHDGHPALMVRARGRGGRKCNDTASTRMRHRERFEEINGFLSASETHNRKNVGRSVAESLDGLRRTFDRARGEGLRCEGVISTSFGCPYEGHVPASRVIAKHSGSTSSSVSPCC